MHALDFLASAGTKERIAAIRSNIVDAIASADIAIVGSAALPQKCALAIIQAGGKVRCFIEFDARFWGKTVLGLPVVSPVAAAEMLEPDALVLVGIWSPHHRYRDTLIWLHAFGFGRVLPVPSVFWVLGEAIGPHYQLAAPDVFLANMTKIRTVYDGLADDWSKAQFAELVRWRVTLDPEAILIPDRHHVYFDPALFRLPDDAVIVDCGAFDGDSLRSFLYWTGERFGRFDALEPDLVSFAKLEAYLAKLSPAVADKIVPRQIAVGAETMKLRFAGSGMPGSRAEDVASTTEVDCLRLDDIYADTTIDYLKFDIEGAEWEALQGADDVIRRSAPVIATAIYHKPADLFELPLYLMGKTPGSKYYIRTHDDDGIDVVFYSVPPRCFA